MATIKIANMPAPLMTNEEVNLTLAYLLIRKNANTTTEEMNLTLAFLLIRDELRKKQRTARTTPSEPTTPSDISSSEEDECDYKSLYATSEPDTPISSPNSSVFNNTPYTGPPIGYSAKVTKHLSPVTGNISTTISGSVLAPRPRYEVWCQGKGCEVCARCYSPSSAGGVEVEYVSPRASPRADIAEIVRRAERGEF